MKYDLSLLNDRDFESLACDVIGVEVGRRIQRFKPGKDGGVDGRFYIDEESQCIVQCKHWQGSGFAKLLRHLVSSEKPKLEKLAPSRYILATSVALSDLEKEKILAALSPYIKTGADIFGYEDICDLLSANPEIETRHPKLWMATASVLDSIINRDIQGRSRFILEEVRSLVRKFVETSYFEQARKLLEAGRVLILKGEPGVGKTTLAQWLMMESAGRAEAVVVEDIEEAEAYFRDESEQFFLFDDFLGRNFLEVIHNNDDSRIMVLLRRVKAAKNKRLILTSRTHILEQGKISSELFRLGNVSAKEYELKIEDLTKLEKAKMLYAHVWAGDMPDWAIDELYAEERYLDVVNHRNFNPRLVSLITSQDHLAGLEREMYWEHVLGALDNPEMIWGHVFHKQLGPDSRLLAHLTALNGRPLGEEDLKRAFFRAIEGDGRTELTPPLRFHQALKISVGAVLNRSMNQEGGVAISLFNPSVADYIISSLQESGYLDTAISSLQTVSSIEYVRGLFKSGAVTEAQHSGLLHDVAARLDAKQADKKFAIRLANEVISSPSTRSMVPANSFVADTLHAHLLSSKEFTDDLLELASKCVASGLNKEANLYGKELLSKATDIIWTLSSMSSLASIANTLDPVGIYGLLPQYARDLTRHWMDNAHQIVRDADVLGEIYDYSEMSIAKAEAQTYIERSFESMDIELIASDVDEMLAAIDFEQIIDDNNAGLIDDDDNDRHERGHGDVSDAEVVDYFSRE